MADIKVPGVGPLDKKKVLIGAGVGVAIIIVVVIMRRRSAAAAAAATPVTPGTSTTDTSAAGYGGIDPATGFDYGSPEDQAALAQQGGYGGSYYGSGIGDTLGNIDPATGYISGSSQDVAALEQLYGTGTSTPAPKQQTETQWVSTAANALQNDAGVGRAAAAEALTEWIAGQSLTAQQAQYVREALALVGNPPNGAPPIHVKSTHPGQTHDKVKVPSVTGKRYPAAAAELAAHHLKARRHPGQRAVNIVTSQNPSAGAEVPEGTVVTLAGEATG